MKADLDTLHCIAILRGGKHAVVTHSSDFNQSVLHLSPSEVRALPLWALHTECSSL